MKARFTVATMVLAALAALAGCAAMAPARPAHPFDEQLVGEWYYECRYFLVDDSFPLSMEGHAIYFDGRTRERIDISAGTDCSEAGRILTMRFEGTYALGKQVKVRLGDAQVEGFEDEEVKTQVTYELTPTFASVVGDDPACKALVGRRLMDGSVPELAQCGVTKSFRELELRSRTDRTVLFVDACRLFNGDDSGERRPDGYPATLDTRTWGVKACRQEQ